MYQIITTDGHESRSAIITDSLYEACETGRAISLIDGGIDAVLFHIDADQPVFMFRNGIKCWLDGEPIRGVA